MSASKRLRGKSPVALRARIAGASLKIRASVSREHLGDVHDLHAEPAVGPVRAVAEHRVVVAHPLQRERDLDAGGREHALEEPVRHVDDVLLVHERQLHVELGELGLAVGAEVLVAEAAGDLEVALVAADHEELLEELRRLRQRVPGAAHEPARHEEVPGALGGRAGHDRRLNLEVALVGEEVADLLHDLMAEDHVVAHRLLAEVEVAIAEAELLADRVVLVDLERRRLGVGELLELGGHELHLAGRKVGVHGGLVAAHQLARDRDHVLGAERSRAAMRLGRLLGAEHELEEPGPVAQVDEDQPAVVAAAVHPARDAHLLADLARAELPRPVRPVAVRTRRLHGRTRSMTSSSVAAGCCSPVCMSLTSMVSPRITVQRAPRRSACFN